MDQTPKSTKSELKLIEVGCSGTGKTSFVNKWTKDIFDDNYKATVVSEFSYKIFEYKNKYYKVQLWDIAGQDQNICVTKIFSKDSHGCIVLSDIKDESTLDKGILWKNSVDDNVKFLDGDYLPSVLVQNKIDLVDDAEVNKFDEKVKEICENHKFVNSFKTSAKMGIGIEECMQFLIGNIIDRMEKCNKDGKDPFEKNRQSIVLQKNKTQSDSVGGNGGCC